MVKAYRIYYTTFYDDEHLLVVEAIRRLTGKEPVTHGSRIRELRFVEVVGEDLQRGLEDGIVRTVKEILGEEAYVRVDFVDL